VQKIEQEWVSLWNKPTSLVENSIWLRVNFLVLFFVWEGKTIQFSNWLISYIIFLIKVIITITARALGIEKDFGLNPRRASNFFALMFPAFFYHHESCKYCWTIIWKVRSIRIKMYCQVPVLGRYTRHVGSIFKKF